MSNPEISTYIMAQLEAGESPAKIAGRLHSWGYRIDTSKAPSRLPSQYSSSGPTKTVSLILGVSMLFVLGVGGFAFWQGTEGSFYNTDTVAQQQATEATPLPALSQALAEREPAVLSAQTDLAEADQAVTQSASNATSDNASSAASSSAFSESDDDSENTAEPEKVSKSEYTIVIMGDSMIDTLDSHFPQLAEEFEARYAATFNVHNYGVGAENVASGLERFAQPLEYKDRSHPAIPDSQADVIIIGSFAYNPFSDHDLNNYWIKMAELVDTAKTTGADVYMLAEVAPVRERFAFGSLEWTVDRRIDHAQKIVDQFNSFLNLSTALEVPVIDAYTPSKKEGDFGNGAYTSLTDGIHANTAGKLLIIEEILKTVTIE
ncbi:MAG: hypothetical protein WDZ94_01405 [Patescibacteria group bacterium]